MRMRHPNLDAVIEIPDDPDCIAAHAEGGWVEAPDETVQHHPALAPGEPLPEGDEPAPKTSKPKPKPEGEPA